MRLEQFGQLFVPSRHCRQLFHHYVSRGIILVAHLHSYQLGKVVPLLKLTSLAEYKHENPVGSL